MRNIKLVFILFSVLTIVALAQEQTMELPTDIITSTGAGYQYWNGSQDQAQQLAIPFSTVVPFGENLRVSVSTTPAFSDIETAGSANLGGMSDTRLGASYMTSNQKLLFTFGANLPSGKNALKPDEFSVANILAIHALDFQVPTLGQGLDLSAGVITAHRVSAFVVGTGVGFLMRGAFDPFADVDYSYNPGDEVSVSLGLDKNITRYGKFMLDASYTFYTPDVADGNNVFKAGNRLTIQATAYLPGELLGFIFSVRNRIQAKNEIGIGTLTPERENSNGNELELNSLVMLTLSHKTTVRGAVEGKVFSDNAFGVGGATVAGFGGGLSQVLFSHLNFDISARYYIGNLNTIGGQVQLSGVKVFGGFSSYL